jgi:hypothetical protein
MPHNFDSVAATRQAAAISRWDDEGGAIGHPLGPPNQDMHRQPNASVDGPAEEISRPSMLLTVDESLHNRDGLLLHGRDQAQQVTAFIGRKVMDEWAVAGHRGVRAKSLFRNEYNALGTRNLPAIERIVRTKYDRGLAFNSQHPFVDVLLSDITESGERLDREPLN